MELADAFEDGGEIMKTAGLTLGCIECLSAKGLPGRASGGIR